MATTYHKSEHARALDAGLTHRESARWLAYLGMKARKGETPIDLHEAVAQVRAARPRKDDL
jgi:hypothetical protein